MTVPLVILAAFTVVLGFLGADFLGNPFEHFVRFEAVPAPPVHGWVVALSVLVAVAGWAAAGAIYYWRIVPASSLRRWFGWLYTLLARRYFIDDFYGWVFLKAGGVVIFLAGAFDRYVIDGLVNALAWLTGRLGLGLRYLQTGREENYLLLIFLSLVIIVLVRLVR